MIRPQVTCLMFLVALVTSAQNYDFSKTWEQDLSISEYNLVVDSTELPAHRVLVHEASNKEALDIWVGIMEGEGASVERLKDAVVADGIFAGDRMKIHAAFTQDKREDPAQVIMAMVDQAGVPMDIVKSKDLAGKYAVQLNQVVVQGQLEQVQKDFEKASKELEGLEKDHEQAISGADNKQASLEKSQDKASKNLKQANSLRNDISKLQKQYTKSNDPKDLAKIADKQKRLAKVEKQQEDLMEDQQKAAKKLDKASGEVPDAVKDIEKQREELEEIASFLEAIKIKLASIR
jgi:hypothetical protein